MCLVSCNRLYRIFTPQGEFLFVFAMLLAAHIQMLEYDTINALRDGKGYDSLCCFLSVFRIQIRGIGPKAFNRIASVLALMLLDAIGYVIQPVFITWKVYLRFPNIGFFGSPPKRGYLAKVLLTSCLFPS